MCVGGSFMLALPALGIVIVFTLIGIFFAGKKNEVNAKRKWTGIVIFLFIAFSMIVYFSMKKDSSDTQFLGWIIIIGSGFAAYLLNSIGHWIISFITTILPDKSDQ